MFPLIWNSDGLTNLYFLGTLTHGVPSVSKLILVAQAGKDLAHSISLTLALLATAESSSEHPLATAITKYAKVMIYNITVVLDYKWGFDVLSYTSGVIWF